MPFQTVFAQSSPSVNHPFFMHGDGVVNIVNSHNGKAVTVTYMNPDGTLNDAAFAKIDGVFGFPTGEKGENISRRTIAMLDYFSDLVGKGKPINLASGYRSESYNQGLRQNGKTAAKTSTHIDGMAIDFSIAGVNGKELWDTIRFKDCCGAGNYGGNIVHLDSGRPRFWEKATSKVTTGASDFNRYIYLSTEYDRYSAGDKARLLFTSISDFGFGIKPTVTLVTDKEGKEKAGELKIDTTEKDCVMINERKDARFIFATLTEKTFEQNVRLRVDFCNKPFTEMPDFAVSNAVEVLAAGD